MPTLKVFRDGQFIELLAVSGDMIGPASSTDNAIVRWDGTGGKTLQDSGASVNDAGSITCVALTATGNVKLDSALPQILDQNSDILLLFSPDGTGVNFVVVSNAGTGAGPTMTAFGETNVDFNINTSGTGVVKFNGVSAVSLGTHSQLFYIEDVATSDDFPMLHVPRAITVTSIKGVTVPSSGTTAAFNIERRAEFVPDSGGTDLMSSDLTADDTGEEQTTIVASGAVAANQILVPTISGTPDATKLWIYVTYTID